jgi:hypothetical protein
VRTAFIIWVMMQVARISESSVYSNETTRRYIPQGFHLHALRRESLKCHNLDSIGSFNLTANIVIVKRFFFKNVEGYYIFLLINCFRYVPLSFLAARGEAALSPEQCWLPPSAPTLSRQ